MEVDAQSVLEACRRTKGQVLRTPVLSSDVANQLTEARIYFKCENLQKTGSFKFRGASHALMQLTDEQRKKGVATFSSGNHGQALALAARELNISAVVVMPQDAPATKISATRAYGAEVILYDRETEDREAIAGGIVGSRGMTLLPPYDHPDIIAGQGTAAAELFEEVGSLDYLFVCVGGGGLIAGSALAAQHFSPGCKVIGAEPEAGDDGGQSFKKGTRVKIAVPQTIADGARTQVLGALPFQVIQKYVHSFETATDAQLCNQMRFFMEHMKLVTEPTGCLSAAVAMNRKFDLKGLRVGVIISGGNIDREKFCEYLGKGVAF